MAQTYTYPFDPTGSATSNAVANERHVLSPPAWKDFYFIVPKQAPYFRDSLRVIHRPSGKLLVEGVDYHCTHYFHAASHGVARRVYGSITMLDKTLTGVLEISYQTIGGDWILDASADLTRLTNTQTNPRITTWEEVVDVPYQFPPIDHEWNLEDLKGVEAILPILDEMTAAIRESAGSSFATHIADKNNPHSVTKDQVGLDQVQNFPLANIAEAQAGSLNTRYMTPVRTKNFVDSYMVPLLDNHKADLNNPHGVTKTQVGLSAVQNYGVATQAEAEAGTATNKYMTPLQTKQAIAALATTGLTAHLADVNNPHATTKAQVGLGSVENLPVASIAEAQAASRNDRYMTPLMTATQIQVLVKDSMDLHINATNNPHLTTKTQVGLSNVLNYALATQAEAEAGLITTAYMTPLMTRKAIEAIATGSIGAHLADNNNPHAVTKAQVGLGSVQNYSIASTVEAQLGTSTIRYMTPATTAAAIAALAGDELEAHVANTLNPHNVTAAQVNAYDKTQTDTLLDFKLGKTDNAANALKLEGRSYQDVLDAAKAQTSANSLKLEGKSLAEVIASVTTGDVANSLHLEGKSYQEVHDQIIADIPYAVQFEVPQYEDVLVGTTNWTPVLIATPDFSTTDFDNVSVLINASTEVADLSTVTLVRVNMTTLSASAVVLSGDPANIQLRFAIVAGTLRIWKHIDADMTVVTVTVLGGTKFVKFEDGAPISTVVPAGTSVIPTIGYSNSADVETLIANMKTSFDTLTTALTALG